MLEEYRRFASGRIRFNSLVEYLIFTAERASGLYVYGRVIGSVPHLAWPPWKGGDMMGDILQLSSTVLELVCGRDDSDRIMNLDLLVDSEKVNECIRILKEDLKFNTVPVF